MGSVFSPLYARARARAGGADPIEHCALNVALYGTPKRWAFTAWPRDEIERHRSRLRIGPNVVHWNGSALTIRIDEKGAPLPRRVRGIVRVFPEATPPVAVTLNTSGNHRWQPIAPRARIEVELSDPAVRWSGVAYLDSNRGDAPLENDFSAWTWSRLHALGSTVVLYDVQPRGAPAFSLGLRFAANGQLEEAGAPLRVELPATRWRVAREGRADKEAACAVVQTLEDTPFYARSLISTRIGGEAGVAIHESLSLDRFRAPWVQRLLPFRMRRG